MKDLELNYVALEVCVEGLEVKGNKCAASRSCFWENKLRLSSRRVSTKRLLTAGDIFRGTEHVRPDEHGDVFPLSRPHHWTGSILVRHFDILLYAEAWGLIRSDT